MADESRASKWLNATADSPIFDIDKFPPAWQAYVVYASEFLRNFVVKNASRAFGLAILPAEQELARLPENHRGEALELLSHLLTEQYLSGMAGLIVGLAMLKSPGTHLFDADYGTDELDEAVPHIQKWTGVVTDTVFPAVEEALVKIMGDEETLNAIVAIVEKAHKPNAG